MPPSWRPQEVTRPYRGLHRSASQFAVLILAFAVVLVFPREALAAVNLTSATGGTDLSVGTFATLDGPVVTEAASGEIGTGAITLRTPNGFEFDPSQTVGALVETAGGNCGGNRSLELNGSFFQIVNPTAGAREITINVTRRSTGGCRARVTWIGLDGFSLTGVKVKSTANGASGSITKTSGGSTISGVTNNSTSFGALSAAQTLSLTLSTNTADFGTGLGPDGSPSNLPAVSVYPDGNTGAYYVRDGGASGHAVSVTINSTAPYTGSVSAAENTGTAGMKISGGSLRWALGHMPNLAAAQGGTAFTTVPNTTVFNQASSCASGQPKQQGDCTFRFDYSLRVLWTDDPGTFGSVVTYTAQQ